jgi:hypothetical protein
MAKQMELERLKVDECIGGRLGSIDCDGDRIGLDELIREIELIKEEVAALPDAIEGSAFVQVAGRENYDYCNCYDCGGYNNGYTGFDYLVFYQRWETDKELSKRREKILRQKRAALKRKETQARQKEQKRLKAEAKERELYEKLKKKFEESGA